MTPALPAFLATTEALQVEVRAPARLHLGFLDPSATLGRRFGSLGLVIDGPSTVVRLAWRGSGTDDVGAAPGAQHEVVRAARHLRRLREALPPLRHGALQLQLLSALPAHAGLGSGTQLALAIGRAYARLMGHETAGIASAELAHLLGRGLRSGIGIAGFDQGGLLLDGGPGPDGRPAPLLSRIALPSAWRVILVRDPRAAGLSGEAEKAALARLSPFAAERAAALCHEVLMRVLPGAADGDFESFALGLGTVQRLLGEHFAPAQPHGAFTSAGVARLLGWIDAHAAQLAGTPVAIGQSSWGPTGFAFVPDAARGEALIAAARAAGVLDAALQVELVRARSQGAQVLADASVPAGRIAAAA
ncbi:beta-ribofuranosylaminobenzene 5'-phosphate synthase family protein [Caldimonas sp. KR1-144]|uniref:beta-ribofuranosylaminobenzene 5'-phosphate synthase family protein n=1 Tax=Caldimonas sp. KR1-144 TaxID=3400911 RepID=UPI003C0B522E